MLFIEILKKAHNLIEGCQATDGFKGLSLEEKDELNKLYWELSYFIIKQKNKEKS